MLCICYASHFVNPLLYIPLCLSSFRFELREDRKKEIARQTGHLNNLRRDLFSRMSPFPSASPAAGRSPQHMWYQHHTTPPTFDNSDFPNIRDDVINTGARYQQTFLKEEQTPAARSDAHGINHKNNVPELCRQSEECHLNSLPTADMAVEWLNTSVGGYDFEGLRRGTTPADAEMSSRRAITAADLEYLKTEIIAGVRREIMGGLRLRSSLVPAASQHYPVQSASGTSSPSHQRHATIPLPPYSELYHTHLYTQL